MERFALYRYPGRSHTGMKLRHLAKLEEMKIGVNRMRWKKNARTGKNPGFPVLLNRLIRKEIERDASNMAMIAVRRLLQEPLHKH